eukprot:s62_g30.t1
MSCPYCLAYAPGSVSKGPSGGARQPRQLEQSRTLVKAYWEFKEGDHWRGFSPNVSVYNVEYTTLLEEGQRESKRIRRVGVTADDNGGHDKAYCTVDPALWRDMQNKLQSFREEQEWLLRLLRSDQDGATVSDMKKDGFYGTLAEDCRARQINLNLALCQEVGRLWQRAGRQAAELEELRSQAQRSSELLERLRSAVLPGRLVRGSNVLGVAAAVETDMVQILQDQGLGSRLAGCAEDVDADLHVSVLRADGKSSPFSVGDVVRACEHDSFAGVEDGPAAGTLGIVMRVCEDLAAEMNSISVRFPDATGAATGFRDVRYTQGQAMEQLERDEALDRIRPGVAVRLRPSAAGRRKHETGVVFSLHGNGMAVVDFLGNWGYECPTFDLEVDPCAMEVEIISALSECLTWEELFNVSNHLTLDGPRGESYGFLCRSQSDRSAQWVVLAAISIPTGSRVTTGASLLLSTLLVSWQISSMGWTVQRIPTSCGLGGTRS